MFYTPDCLLVWPLASQSDGRRFKLSFFAKFMCDITREIHLELYGEINNREETSKSLRSFLMEFLD